MLSIIIGNLLSLCATVSDSISSTRKTYKSIMLVQTVSQIFFIASAVVLKGYSAATQNVVSIFRNLFAVRGKRNRLVEWFFVAAAVVLGLVFNNLGFVGLLPVLANLEYSIAVFRFQNNELALKISFLITISMFTVFNIVIQNYVGFASNCFLMATTSISIIKELKKRKASCT